MFKSITNALWFLRYTPSYIINKDDYYLLSKNKDESNHYHLVLFNYKEPIIGEKRDFNSYNHDPYSLFEGNNKKLIHFKLTDIPYKYASIKMFVLSEDNGGSYENWIKMGKPNFNDDAAKKKRVYRIYKSKAYPDFIQKIINITNNTLKCNFELNLFEIYGVEITLTNEIPNL